MSLSNECGTEWWCPVVSFFVANEAVLRWGVVLTALAWALWFEWGRRERSRPFINQLQSKLNWPMGLFHSEMEPERVFVLGLISLAWLGLQFSSNDGVLTSAQMWFWTLVICVLLSWYRISSYSKGVALICVIFADGMVRVACRSTRGPFHVRKDDQGESTERKLATFNDLIDYLNESKPKSN